MSSSRLPESPRAALAASIVTNFHQPEHESSVVVQVGVAYDSDLDLLERVTCEVGKEVMRLVDGAAPAHEPTVRFHTFADSSIDFSVGLRASEATAQYLIVHEFTKRLHRRYPQEGIDMPFPVRTVPVPGPGGSGTGTERGVARRSAAVSRPVRE